MPATDMQSRSTVRYRRHKAKNRRLRSALLKTGAGVLGTALLSLLFVFCHDVVTQCRYFTIREITVSGGQRISKDRILRQAELRPGMNVFSVNLSVARKSLLAHPWISEAAIRRVVPSGLRITVREHRPLAIVDLGRRFLIDDNGTIFKELGRSDPQDLPVIRGLGYSDIELDPPAPPKAYRSSEAIAATPFERNPVTSSIYRSAVRVLLLGREETAVLPNKKVRFIQVDREIGVTIHLLDREKSIRLGFDDYARKLDVLQSILAFTGEPKSWRLGEIGSIDLKNPDRVVVNLLRKKEV